MVKTIKRDKDSKVTVTLAYLFMILINILANTLPLNGVTTGQISIRYDNLFVPASYTFIIWSVIYLGLGGFVIFQWRDAFFSPETNRMMLKLRRLFSYSCLANALWIVLWHYDLILLSLFAMLGLRVALQKSMKQVHSAKLTSQERIWVHKPFSIYYSWINVALIANVAAFLVKHRIDFGSLSDEVMTVLALLIGFFIIVTITSRYKDITFGIVAIWSFSGILVRHIDSGQLAGSYPFIICILAIILIALSGLIGFLSYMRFKRMRIKYSA
ncbi:MAG: hypothetical protein BGO41_03465 [Clostridiales bacterium 38-18]|nr:MAG: hypothetical protein BGO41_03465 [Clostridiales bacterium 38-18]